MMYFRKPRSGKTEVFAELQQMKALEREDKHGFDLMTGMTCRKCGYEAEDEQDAREHRIKANALDRGECPSCQVVVEEDDGILPNGDVEYPAGCHAVGCEEAEPGSYHPKDPRRGDSDDA